MALDEPAAIILAAGKGTRMRSQHAKVLNKIAGLSMIGHVLTSCQQAAIKRIAVVIADDQPELRAEINRYAPEAAIIVQPQRLGTAHAVGQTRDLFQKNSGNLLVLNGDTPLIRPQTLRQLYEQKQESDIAILSFNGDLPNNYGRVILDDEGQIVRIVEVKDADSDELKNPLCNSGVYCLDSDLLFNLVDAVKNDNKAGEYYLTDIIAIAVARGLRCSHMLCNSWEVQGVNDRLELAGVEAAWQKRAREYWLAQGVTMVAPESVYFSHDTKLAPEVLVEPNVIFAGSVEVAVGARIRAFSYLENCSVGSEAIVGPFARLRPGADVGDNAAVGNFVEIKNSKLAKGVKVNHLTYIGDSDIGAQANIGAGTITCNYDGIAKYKTRIGEKAFVGSNSSLVAPVNIGKGAYIGSGSVITRDVPEDALGLSRQRQVNKEGLARKLRKPKET